MKRRPIFIKFKDINKIKSKRIKNERVKIDKKQLTINDKKQSTINDKKQLTINDKKQKIIIKNQGLLIRPLRITKVVRNTGSPLNQIYDQIYLINLQKRTDRYKLMNYKLNDLGISYVKVDAIDGRKYNHEFLKYKSKSLRSNGAYGLLVTYAGIIRDAQKNKYRRILCLEDDCNFHKNFNNLIMKNSNVFNKYPIVYLGANQSKWTPQINRQISSKNHYFVEYGKSTWGTFAIGFNQTMYRPLLELINNKKTPIDHIFNSLINQKKLKAFVFFPNLIIADRTTSDIQSNIRKNQGNHLQNKWNSKLKWNINNYKYFSIYDYSKITNRLGLTKINQINNDIVTKNELQSLIGDKRISNNILKLLSNNQSKANKVVKTDKVDKVELLKFIGL